MELLKGLGLELDRVVDEYSDSNIHVINSTRHVLDGGGQGPGGDIGEGRGGVNTQ